MKNLNTIIEVKKMISEAKKNKTFNLNEFVEHPYRGFNTGEKTIRTMSLGTEDNFYIILSILEKLDYSEKEKEEISIVLWVFRGLQEDATIRRKERRLEEVIGMKKVPYPHDDDSDEYNVIREDSEIKNELFSYLNDYQPFPPVSDELLNAIGRLNDKHKAAISLILIDGYSKVAAARVLGIKPSSFHELYNNALKKLKKILVNPNF